MSFRTGDRVVATLPGFTETFVVTGLRYSITGRPMFEVKAVGEPRSVGTVFYSDELHLVSR